MSKRKSDQIEDALIFASGVLAVILCWLLTGLISKCL